MVRVKIDNRIRTLIENGANVGHRSLFVIVGEKSRDQVITLYHILTKIQIKTRPSVLWCYKKVLGFSTHRKKRIREIQKLRKAGLEVDDDNPLDLFIASANVRWCYYHETDKILGHTYGMAVLQDFEAMQPNILARTIETVEGGGIVVILLNTLNSLKQLYTMSMDVHARYRTESHQDVVSRFNERFILSLMDCKNSCIIDDRFNILPVCSHLLEITPVPKTDTTQVDPKLIELRENFLGRQPLGPLVALCRTVDQAKAVIKFSESLVKKTYRATVSLTAARGRGKSAALGLSIASAIAHGYSNIYVTSPSPENLVTLFEFALKGLKAVNYAEHHDFTVIRSQNQEHGDAIIRIEVYKDHNQIIQYIDPVEAARSKTSVQMSNLFVIDEAAAIPMPIVKAFLNSQLVFLSSTINGYEGTGRSLSLKLLSQLRLNNTNQARQSTEQLANSRLVHELSLDEPIRYKANDPVESWLTNLLCLDATIFDLPWIDGLPAPDYCQLYYIERDALFSYHKSSEAFLQQLMALYVASHYKNTPNDLQMISDAPAHHLFCLLPPGKKAGALPEVLCLIQVSLEGQISRESIINSLAQGKKSASGDLIPWTISRQFNDSNFACLSGARVVRIATHPNYQKNGYGTRALQLLFDYYSGEFNINLSQESDKATYTNSPPLLMGLHERKAEKLDYLGVSFGLTLDLFRYWKKNKFVPVYLRQTPSDTTGEHSCIMLKQIDPNADWLNEFFEEFRADFIELLTHRFRDFSPQLALGVIRSVHAKPREISISRQELYKFFLTSRKLAILELFCKSLVDYHQILPLIFKLSKLYFLGWLPSGLELRTDHAIVILAMGVQGKTPNQAAAELNLDPTQVLGLFSRAVKKITTHLQSVEKNELAEEFKEEFDKELQGKEAPVLDPIRISLAHELSKAAKKSKKKMRHE